MTDPRQSASSRGGMGHEKFIGVLIFYFFLIYLWLVLFAPTWIPTVLRVGAPREPVNILLLGIDRDYDDSRRVIRNHGRSDTIVIAQFNPITSKINMLSIPRDTVVRIPNGEWQKANAAFAFGGPKLATETFSKFLGIPIHRYMIFSLNAVEDMVDAVGGVRIYVNRPMSYTDRAGKLNIHLKEGWQNLDGDKAHQFIRFRKEALGDIARIQHQQIFLTAFLNRLTSWRGIIGIPRILMTLQRNIETNMPFRDVLKMAHFARMLSRSDIQMIMLPGTATPTPGLGSTWVPNLEEKATIVNQYFAWPPEVSASSNRFAINARVAILNTSGHSEWSKKASDILQRRNIFVTMRQMVDRPDYRQSEILVQRGDMESGKYLGKLLNISRQTVRSTGDVSSDFTVIIGPDWNPPR